MYNIQIAMELDSTNNEIQKLNYEIKDIIRKLQSDDYLKENKNSTYEE